MIQATPAVARTASSNAPATSHGRPDRDEFMKLLMGQLTHQDPLRPMSSQEMIQQMVGIESVDRIQSLEKKIGNLSAAVFMTSGQLVGKTVEVQDPSDSEKSVQGVVQSLKIKNGSVSVIVDGNSYPVESVTSIQ